MVMNTSGWIQKDKYSMNYDMYYIYIYEYLITLIKEHDN